MSVLIEASMVQKRASILRLCRLCARRPRFASSALTPVTPMKVVAVPVRMVERFHPNRVRPGRQNPSSRHPDPASAHPVPISVNPNVTGTRRNANRPDRYNRRRRWWRADNNADIYVSRGRSQRHSHKHHDYRKEFLASHVILHANRCAYRIPIGGIDRAHFRVVRAVLTSTL
jgi:hypothetical protein